MGEITLKSVINEMTTAEIERVRKAEQIVKRAAQEQVETIHTIHSGVYTRTIMIPAKCVLTGALIKIPTTLIVAGKATVYVGDKFVGVNGYRVFAASAHRKQMFITDEDTWLTMIFRTDAKTVYDAEEEFTDEASDLFSRNGVNKNITIITGG